MIMSCRIDCGEPKRAQTENLLEVSEVFVTSAKRSMPGIVPLQCLPSPFVLDEQIHMSQKGGTERQNSMTCATSLCEKEKARSRLYMYKYITYFKDKLSINHILSKTSTVRTICHSWTHSICTPMIHKCGKPMYQSNVGNVYFVMVGTCWNPELGCPGSICC